MEEQAHAKALADAATREAEGRAPAKTNPQDAVPDAKDQRNFTDPESRIMRTSNKGWDQCGNAQAVANEDQIIVAADVTDQTNDCRQMEPMVALACENLAAVEVSDSVQALTADAGYFSEANVTALEKNEQIDEVYIATGRLKHDEKVPEAPKGRPPKDLSAKEKMARKLRTNGAARNTRGEGDHRAGLWTNQTLPRFPTVFATRHGQDEGRMDARLPDPQSVEALQENRIGNELKVASARKLREKSCQTAAVFPNSTGNSRRHRRNHPARLKSRPTPNVSFPTVKFVDGLLVGVSLNDANQGADFSGHDLSRADLRGLTLGVADFTGAVQACLAPGLQLGRHAAPRR